MQAPVPYLNRALAEEQLGVDADKEHQHQQAQQQYTGAVKVGLITSLFPKLCQMYRLKHLTGCTCQYRDSHTPFMKLQLSVAVFAWIVGACLEWSANCAQILSPWGKIKVHKSVYAAGLQQSH